MTMPKTTRSNSSAAATGGRDLRALLHVPQHDLQAQLATRLERLGFPALRPALVQLLSVIGSALVILKINPFWERAIDGALLLGAIALDRLLMLRVASGMSRSSSAVRF